MKRFAMVALILVLLFGMLPARAEDATATFGSWLDGAVSSVETWARDSGELEVRGQAVRTVSPDTVHIRVGTGIEGKDEKEVQTQANSIINNVIDALRALGVEESRIKTGSYDVSRIQKSTGLLSQADSFQSRITLDVTVQDFTLINSILDTAAQMGANTINGISYSCSNEGAVYQEALTDAIAAARTKAETMANAAGVELYTLLSLQEGAQGRADTTNVYAIGGASSTQSARESLSGAQIMSGEIEISAFVTMVYQIK